MSNQKLSVIGLGIATLDYLFVVDHFPQPDEKMRAEQFRIEGGGNCNHTLTALARLGCQTAIVTRVGNDNAGQMILELCKQEQIDVSYVQVDESPSPISFIIVDTSKQTRTIINSLKIEPSLYHLPNAAFLKHYQLAFFDGRYLSQAITLATLCRTLTITVAVEAERLRPGLDLLLKQAHIAFISKRFHEEFFGNLNYEQNLNSVLKMGPRIAVTTLGKEGAIIKTKEKLLTCQAPAVNIIDTTGAGDAFNGSFLFGYLQGLDLELVLKLAIHYAARKCQFLGTKQGMGTVTDYQAPLCSK